MAEKRMFSKSIVLSDAFLDMPASARCLYFTLNMFGDDDGFVDSPKGIMRQCGASSDDVKILVAKRFIIPFESGVIVIKHWRINNYLRCDRYKETIHKDEKDMLEILKDGSYGLKENLLSEQLNKDETEQMTNFIEEQPKLKLVIREPKNDLEIVEKQYLENYNFLFQQGIVRSAKPIINWSASRKLTKDCISKYGLNNVLQAVKNSIKNDFCIQKGYCLTTILSSGVLAGLINNGTSPPKSLQDKYDLGDMVS